MFSKSLLCYAFQNKSYRIYYSLFIGNIMCPIKDQKKKITLRVLSSAFGHTSPLCSSQQPHDAEVHLL